MVDEAIPLTGPDNLIDAITYVSKIAFNHRASPHKQSESLWVHINTRTGKADAAKWARKAPGASYWIAFSLDRFLMVQNWLILHYFIRLGDKVCRQQKGIPMGFSCSPLWCNTYFIAYELQFMQRLAQLKEFEVMRLFHHAYRYIDDLCIINHPSICRFLQPQAIRSPDNPYWIYPLDVVDIQPELDLIHPTINGCGQAAHFLNVHINIVDILTGKFETTKFDKSHLLPFPFQQYIQYKSNCLVRQSYNIAISQIIPILYLSSNADLAITEVCILVNTLQTNGFFGPRLERILYRVCTSGTFPGLKFPIEEIFTILFERIHFRIQRGCSHSSISGENESGDFF